MVLSARAPQTPCRRGFGSELCCPPREGSGGDQRNGSRLVLFRQEPARDGGT
jgi:hypothetical protein